MRRISFPHRLENLTCYLVVLVGSLFNWSRYLMTDAGRVRELCHESTTATLTLLWAGMVFKAGGPRGHTGGSQSSTLLGDVGISTIFTGNTLASHIWRRDSHLSTSTPSSVLRAPCEERSLTSFLNARCRRWCWPFWACHSALFEKGP